MKKIIYTIVGNTKCSWIYEKNSPCKGYTVQEFDKGIETSRTFNTNYEVENTILSIIKDGDFTKMYQKNDIIVILLKIV